MATRRPTYEELESRLAETERALEAIREGKVDAVVGTKDVYVLRLREMEEALREAGEERERRLAAQAALSDISYDILAQTDISGLLNVSAHAARRLTGARLASCGHGYMNGRFRTGATSRDSGIPDCPPGRDFSIRKGGLYMEVLDRTWSFRLTDARMRSHPRWWGLPKGHVPLDGLMGARLMNSDGSPNGMILASHKDKGDFTAEDEGTLSQLAAMTSLALRNLMFQEALEHRVDERTMELEQKASDLQILNREMAVEIGRRAEMEARQKKTEEELRLSNKKVLEEIKERRFLAGRLVKLIERDRSEMGMALHDEAGQWLTALRMELEDIKGGLPPGHLLDKVEVTEKQTTELLGFIRDFSNYLRPASLKRLGVVSSVRGLVEDVKKKMGGEVHFHFKEVPANLHPDKELALYRIIQESLTNIQRHARAGRVFVNLIRKGTTLHLSVEDDGVGFDPQDLERDHGSQGEALGLSIMKERATQVGGDFWIESEKGKGTLACACIPVGDPVEGSGGGPNKIRDENA